MKFYHEKLGIPGSPYLHRWVADLIRFSLRLHHWFHSDDHRNPHDHDWNFIVIPLWGSYIDHCYDRKTDIWIEKEIKPLSVHYRPMDYIHWVEVRKPCWTLLITGPQISKQGFWLNKDKRMKANKYFFTFGHHTPDGSEPIRTKKIKEGLSESYR